MRRNGRLDHRGEAHGRIAAAGLERRPFGGGHRQRERMRAPALVQFGKQQPGGIHIAARDMGMNIDGARHDDLAGDVMHFIRHACPAAAR